MSAQPTSAPNLGMKPTTFENPMGIDGFEFVEFAAPAGQGEALHALFRRMGFTAVMKHRTRPVTVYRQGGVNFLVNESTDGFAAQFEDVELGIARTRAEYDGLPQICEIEQLMLAPAVFAFGLVAFAWQLGLFAALANCESEWLFLFACDLPLMKPSLISSMLPPGGSGRASSERWSRSPRAAICCRASRCKAWTMPRSRSAGAAPSASCSSSTTCCRPLPRWRTSRCRR